MKFFATALLTAAFALTGVAAHANDHGEHAKKPAVANPSLTQQNPTAPVEGKNSFTNLQAQERVAAAGYTDISAFEKDDSGIWHGTAKKAGMSHNVMVDYQGNVTSAE